MLKQIRTLFAAVAVLALLASCQTAGKDVREDARNAVQQGEQPANNDVTTAVQPSAPAGPTTNVEWDEMEFDFGTVAEGEKVSHTYVFKNTGNEPLVFSDAKGSCGCTVPKWPREPIAPGASGEIVVEFNTQGKAGNRNQKVTLTANTNPPQTFLSLKGVVAGASQPNTMVNQ